MKVRSVGVKRLRIVVSVASCLLSFVVAMEESRPVQQRFSLAAEWEQHRLEEKESRPPEELLDESELELSVSPNQKGGRIITREELGIPPEDVPAPARDSVEFIDEDLIGDEIPRQYWDVALNPPSIREFLPYMLIPLAGFAIPWFTITTVAWIVEGFVSDFRGKPSEP